MMEKKCITEFIISEKMTIMEALQKIDSNGRGIAFVCEDDKLKAVLSDGDIRRYILNKGDMEALVREVANYNPKMIMEGGCFETAKIMKMNRITALPVVDNSKRIIKICFKDGEEVRNSQNLNIKVVIMAGGKGTRLYPYTQILPKPLIPIGNKTITEHIMDRFADVGCNDVTMIVNYKKRFIETYFAEDSRYSVKFVEEEKFCGTGGGLKLLKDINDTFFLTNCDILLEADYSHIYREHKEEKNIITVVCAKKTVEIPYGIVQKDEKGNYVGLIEKPTYPFLINTGFYIIEPEFLDRIPEDTFVHITDIIEKCAEAGEKVGVYEVEEEAWMDMGQMDELEKMKKRIGGTENV